ncbi:hypothetical protein EAO69_06385 [Streptomyces sp. me109]|nr:hypothetical protein EAO69_06385 [Streptomyces sp. me109]
MAAEEWCCDRPPCGSHHQQYAVPFGK